MPTDEWLRINEDKNPPFRKQTFTMGLGPNTYDVTVDPLSPHEMTVIWAAEERVWRIELIEKNGAHYRISGMAGPAEPILNDHAWFELSVDAAPKIVYWGDRVVIRTDRAVGAAHS
jgi:hypothetical protein